MQDRLDSFTNTHLNLLNVLGLGSGGPIPSAIAHGHVHKGARVQRLHAVQPRVHEP